MGVFRMSDLDTFVYVLHDTAKRAPDGISGVARRRAMRPKALMERLDPNDPDRLPNVGDLVFVMQDANDTAPLEVLCEMFGGQFTTRTEGEAHDLMAAILSVGAKHGEAFERVEQAFADGVLEDHEKPDVHRALADYRRAVNALERSAAP
jgi:hypothetical protein